MISAVESWLDNKLNKLMIDLMRNEANRTYKHEIYINKVTTTNIILNEVIEARSKKGYPPLDSMTYRRLASNLFSDVYNVQNVQVEMDKQFGVGRVHVQGTNTRTEIHLSTGLFAETKTTSKGSEQKLVNAAMQELYYKAIGYMRRTISQHRGVNERGYKTKHPGLSSHGVLSKPGAQTTIAGLALTENFDAEMESIMDDLQRQFPGKEHQGTMDAFKQHIINPIKSKYIIKDAQDFDTKGLDRNITIQAEYGDAAYNRRMQLYDSGAPLRNAIKIIEDGFLKEVGSSRDTYQEYGLLDGSRSFVQKTNTIVPKTIIDNLFPHTVKADMRLKVNKKLLADAQKDIGRKNTKGSVKSKSSKGTRTGRAGRGVKRAKGKAGTRVSSKAGTSPLALRNMLNELLPVAIAKNMTSPALNYRTGRFANSVRVDNVTQGPRGGNTMIQASYMNNPYETFAPGGDKYTPQRNPEKLIKGTLREVAQGIVGTKFGVNVR
jgi:hypothetical protein